MDSNALKLMCYLLLEKSNDYSKGLLLQKK